MLLCTFIGYLSNTVVLTLVIFIQTAQSTHSYMTVITSPSLQIWHPLIVLWFLYLACCWSLNKLSIVWILCKVIILSGQQISQVTMALALNYNHIIYYQMYAQQSKGWHRLISLVMIIQLSKSWSLPLFMSRHYYSNKASCIPLY